MKNPEYIAFCQSKSNGLQLKCNENIAENPYFFKAFRIRCTYFENWPYNFFRLRVAERMLAQPLRHLFFCELFRNYFSFFLFLALLGISKTASQAISTIPQMMHLRGSAVFMKSGSARINAPTVSKTVMSRSFFMFSSAVISCSVYGLSSLI